MPTYDYACDGCGHTFEEYQSITAAPLKVCPACRKPKLKRLLGAGGGIIFKGGGFYQTDYRPESYKKAAEAEAKSAAPAAADSKSDGAGKPKPEAAAADKPAAKAPAAPEKPAAKSKPKK